MELNESLKIFNNNLKFLMKKNNITQKKLSEITGISPASINNYVNKGKEPSVELLLALKDHYDINLNDIFSLDISNEIVITPKLENGLEKLNKFTGSYIMYFYNSSEYKGKLSTYSKNTLKYAVVSFIFNSEAKKIVAIANFMKDRDLAEELKEKLDTVEVYKKEEIHKSVGPVYCGNLEASDTQIFIYLKSAELNDQSLFILNNSPSNKTYVGGLGTVNSVSRGREHMPCIQFAILSRSILRVSDGELYNLLALGVSDVNVEIEADQLISLFKNLYMNNISINEDLSEYQKKKVFENSLTNILIELIDANMFRFAKISNMEDDDYYRIIKGDEE